MDAFHSGLPFLIPVALAVTFMLWVLWKFWLEGRK